MAYKQITQQAYADKTALALLISNGLVAMGWTLFDDQTPSLYRVYRTNGENSARPYVYCQVNYSTANVNINISPFWNAATHTLTPTGQPGAAPTFTIASHVVTSGHFLWMYGNKDFFVTATEINTTGVLNGPKSGCGYILNPPAGYVRTTSTIASTVGGTSLAVTNVTGFIIGARYQIFDPATGFRQNFICQGIAGSVITTDALATVVYGIGSLVGTSTLEFWLGTGAGINPQYSMNHHRIVIYNGAMQVGSCLGSVTATDDIYLSMGLPYFGTLSKRIMFPPVFYESGTGPSTYRYLGDVEDGNGYYYIIPPLTSTNFNDTSPGTGVSLDALYFGQIDTGVCDNTSTVTYMNDTTTGKNWATDIHKDKVYVALSGPAVGTIRRIVSNTNNQLTVTPNFATIPSSGTYVIADRAYRYFLDSLGFLFREGV